MEHRLHTGRLGTASSDQHLVHSPVWAPVAVPQAGHRGGYTKSTIGAIPRTISDFSDTACGMHHLHAVGKHGRGSAR